MKFVSIPSYNGYMPEGREGRISDTDRGDE